MVPASAAPCAEVIVVEHKSLDWLTHRGALLVPIDDRAARLLRQLSETTLIWGSIMLDADSEKGYGRFWHVVDRRGL